MCGIETRNFAAVGVISLAEELRDERKEACLFFSNIPWRVY
jgi:hypothetical protein